MQGLFEYMSKVLQADIRKF